MPEQIGTSLSNVINKFEFFLLTYKENVCIQAKHICEVKKNAASFPNLSPMIQNQYCHFAITIHPFTEVKNEKLLTGGKSLMPSV